MRNEMSVEELKRAICAIMHMQQVVNKRMQQPVQQVLGVEAEEEDQDGMLFRSKIVDLGADIIAKRLKRNRRSTPLIIPSDFKRILPIVVDFIRQNDDNGFCDEDLGAFRKSVRNIFNEIFSMGADLAWGYDDYWKWIRAIITVADGRGISLADIPLHEDAMDDVMRTVYSREEFICYYGKVLSKVADVNDMKRAFILTKMESLQITDAKIRRKVKKELDAQLSPIMKNCIDMIRAPLQQWLDGEVARMYASV